MAVELTDGQKAIIDGRNFAHVATRFPNGSIQVNPVWIDRDGNNVQLNSAEGRAKVENLRSDPAITIEVNNHENPYQYVEVRGRVIEITHEGADAHIDALAKKYMDADSYPLRKASEVRVKIVVEVERALGNAPDGD